MRQIKHKDELYVGIKLQCNAKGAHDKLAQESPFIITSFYDECFNAYNIKLYYTELMFILYDVFDVSDSTINILNNL